MKPDTKNSPYTCIEYRDEMILLSLQRQMSDPDLSPEEKTRLLKEIVAVKARMGLN